MKKLFVLLLLLGVVFSVTSCNMIKGAGQDVKDAGDAVQDAGDAVQDAGYAVQDAAD